MKKTILALALLCVAIVFACRKDLSPDIGDINSNLFLTEAKNFYYQKAKKIGLSPATKIASINAVKNKSGSGSITPLWHNNYMSKAGANEFVEVPIVTTKKEITLYNFSNESTTKKTDLIRVNSSFKRLLIYKTARGNFNNVVLTYVPDIDYLEESHYNASTNQINKLDKNFSGYIEFSNLETEKKLFVIRFKKGKFLSKRFSRQPEEFNAIAFKLSDKLKSSKKSMSGPSPKENLMSQAACTLLCVPVYAVYCFEMGDPAIETCTEPVEVGEDCAYYCYEEPEDPGQDPCSDPANFYMCNPDDPSNPTPPDSDTPEDPCIKKGNVKNQLENERVDSLNNKILSHLNDPNHHEWGAKINLKSTSATETQYKPTPVVEGVVGSVDVGFNWNSTDGYTIGSTHLHPGNTAPSLSDILTLTENLSQGALTSAGSAAVEFYKSHAYITVVTGDGNYVITVNDWGGLQRKNDYYESHTVALDAALNSLRLTYEQDLGYTEAQSSTVALLTYYESYISIFKAPSNSKEYKPYKLDETEKLIETPCPN